MFEEMESDYKWSMSDGLFEADSQLESTFLISSHFFELP